MLRRFNCILRMRYNVRSVQLTYLAVLTGPAHGAVTHKAVDLILTVAVHARVRIALVNLCNETQLTYTRYVITAAGFTPQRNRIFTYVF